MLIVGGGLAGSLAAWRLAQTRPDLSVSLIESGPALGGNHTWSFHATDLTPEARAWISPLVVARWPAHAVAFPGMARTLAQEYCSLTSTRLHEVVTTALGQRVRLGATAEPLSSTEVRLSDGARLKASVVIDARGAAPLAMRLGWQTFVGQDVECDAPHGVTTPTIMDATVPQTGAFKFIYVLPWSPTRLLIEDTAYADDAAIDGATARGAIAAYAAARGWRVAAVLREEHGALPLPLGGQVEDFWRGLVPRVGLRAGLFHPTTGYSLPDAVATADLIARVNPFTAEHVYSEVKTFAAATWRERAFFRLLNRWLFRAAAPEARAGVLAQFYRRPDDLIARFYAGHLSTFDRLRLLTGRPPVPVWRALAHLWE